MTFKYDFEVRIRKRVSKAKHMREDTLTLTLPLRLAISSLKDDVILNRAI